MADAMFEIAETAVFICGTTLCAGITISIIVATIGFTVNVYRKIKGNITKSK